MDRSAEVSNGREALLAAAARRLALLTLAQLGWDRNASPIGMMSKKMLTKIFFDFEIAKSHRLLLESDFGNI